MLNKIQNLLVRGTILSFLVIASLTVLDFYRQTKQIYILSVIGTIDYKQGLKLELYALLVKFIADYNDTIIVKINTPGGLTTPTLNLVHELNMTDARVIALGGKIVASAGTYLFASCPEVIFSDDTLFMIHQPKLQNRITKETKQLESNDKSLIYTNNLIKNIWFEYLTLEEQTAFLNGKDVWIKGKDLRERLKK